MGCATSNNTKEADGEQVVKVDKHDEAKAGVAEQTETADSDSKHTQMLDKDKVPEVHRTADVPLVADSSSSIFNSELRPQQCSAITQDYMDVDDMSSATDDGTPLHITDIEDTRSESLCHKEEPISISSNSSISSDLEEEAVSEPKQEPPEPDVEETEEVDFYDKVPIAPSHPQLLANSKLSNTCFASVSEGESESRTPSEELDVSMISDKTRTDDFPDSDDDILEELADGLGKDASVSLPDIHEHTSSLEANELEPWHESSFLCNKNAEEHEPEESVSLSCTSSSTEHRESTLREDTRRSLLSQIDEVIQDQSKARLSTMEMSKSHNTFVSLNPSSHDNTESSPSLQMRDSPRVSFSKSLNSIIAQKLRDGKSELIVTDKYFEAAMCVEMDGTSPRGCHVPPAAEPFVAMLREQCDECSQVFRCEITDMPEENTFVSCFLKRGTVYYLMFRILVHGAAIEIYKCNELALSGADVFRDYKRALPFLMKLNI